MDQETLAQKAQKAKPIMFSLRKKLHQLNDYKFEYMNKKGDLEFEIEFNKLAGEPFKDKENELEKINAVLERLITLTAEVQETLKSLFRNMRRQGYIGGGVDELMGTIDNYLAVLANVNTEQITPDVVTQIDSIKLPVNVGGRKSRKTRKSRKSRKTRK